MQKVINSENFCRHRWKGIGRLKVQEVVAWWKNSGRLNNTSEAAWKEPNISVIFWSKGICWTPSPLKSDELVLQKGVEKKGGGAACIVLLGIVEFFTKMRAKNNIQKLFLGNYQFFLSLGLQNTQTPSSLSVMLVWSPVQAFCVELVRSCLVLCVLKVCPLGNAFGLVPWSDIWNLLMLLCFFSPSCCQAHHAESYLQLDHNDHPEMSAAALFTPIWCQI